MKIGDFGKVTKFSPLCRKMHRDTLKKMFLLKLFKYVFSLHFDLNNQKDLNC